MEIDDHDFSVVRKNLNILSVLILILAYTEAKIQSLNFLNIQIDLNGDKLYIAIFLGYVYFIWRFFTKLPLLTGFWAGFQQFYMDSQSGIRTTHNEPRYRKNFIMASPRLKKSIDENDAYFRFLQLSIIRLQDWPMSRVRLVATYSSTGSGNGEQPNFFVEHDIQISKFFFFRKLISFCVTSDKFGDYLFPLVFVLLNFLFFLFKASWQGSLYQLFLE